MAFSRAGNEGSSPLAMDISDSSSSSSDNTTATDFSDYNPAQDPEFVVTRVERGSNKRKLKSQKEKDGNKKQKKESKKRRVKVKPFKYKRYRYEGPPITKAKDIPDGWEAQDRDLREDDIEGNIQRCHDRIADGIMPHLWEKRLKVYTERKKLVDEIKASESESLSWETVTRLKNLESLKEHLEKNGDKRFNQLPNVIAIMKAYRSGKLVWTSGLVTYWSKGKALSSKPVEYNWKEFCKYVQKTKDHVWVEGLNGPGPLPMLSFHNPSFRTVVPADDDEVNLIEFSVRVPRLPLEADEAKGPPVTTVDAYPTGGTGTNFHGTFKFYDDTGATMPRLYEDDLDLLYSMSEQPAPFVSYVLFRTAIAGYQWEPTCLLEMTLNDDNLLINHGKLTRPFVVQQCAISEGFCPDAMLRLGGQWLRQYFYVATIPNNETLPPPNAKAAANMSRPSVAARYHQNSLYISETYSGLTKILPKRNAKNAKAPDLIYPASDVTGTLNPKSALARTWVIDGQEFGPLVA